MIADGYLVGDGSWTLRVFVTDMDVERTLRVKGDTHIGGVMLKLAEDLALSKDWSDHALWWPLRNCWLSRTRSTLDQCGVAADSLLHFTPMHKALRVQLPDLRFLSCQLDFSVKTFNAVMALCKELGVRHPEELSLCRPLRPSDLKHNYKEGPLQPHNLPPDTNTFIAASGRQQLHGSLDAGGAPLLCAPVLPPRSQSATPLDQQNGFSPRPGSGLRSPGLELGGAHNTSATLELQDGCSDSSLASSPVEPGREARESLVRPKSLVERARMNVGWLDSSLSIMEQGVREGDCLRLRFKFSTCYDLNPRTDAVRINQLYQQARWQILNEEVDCTEEEMLVFAGLQVQVNLQTAEGLADDTIDSVTSGIESLNTTGLGADEEVELALAQLQATLEGGRGGHNNDITHVPDLCDNLRYLKPRRFTLKAYKRQWFTCRELQLRAYRSAAEANSGGPPSLCVSLRGAEVAPDLNLSAQKYGIRLQLPGEGEGEAGELWLRCDGEEQYARWLAALRLAARGRTLADAGWESEAAAIRDFLALQRPAPQPAISPRQLDLNPADYIAPRFQRKFKGKVTQRILENHANVKQLSCTEAKLQFIRAWQNLPDHGLALFVVKFMGQRKEELIGVAHNRIVKLDMSTGDLLKTWRYSTMKAWNVNWEIKHMMVQFEEGNIIFSCQSADCKVIHEFIGGYIFLSMRSKDANQTLDEELFHKLTGGWV